MLRYSDLPAGTPQAGRGCCIFQVGRNPYKFGKETESHPGGRKEKNFPPGLTIWDCWVLPCTTNTQQEGFAFLTKSPLAPGAWAAGGRVRVRGCVEAGSPGWGRAGYRRWKGMLYLVLAVWLCQPVSFPASGNADVHVEELRANAFYGVFKWFVLGMPSWQE